MTVDSAPLILDSPCSISGFLSATIDHVSDDLELLYWYVESAKEHLNPAL